MQVQIDVTRKNEVVETYLCGAYKVRDASYIYLYENNCSVSPTSLLEIVPIHSPDIVSVSFKYLKD